MDLFWNREVIHFLMFYKFKCSHIFQILLGIQGGISFSVSHESLFSAALVAAVVFFFFYVGEPVLGFSWNSTHCLMILNPPSFRGFDHKCTTLNTTSKQLPIHLMISGSQKRMG